MTGRIEVYTHSDDFTQNKGAAMIKVLCDTDFAARTDEFLAFSKKAARFVYGFNQCFTWAELIEQVPDLEQDRVDLERSLKEKITIVIEHVCSL